MGRKNDVSSDQANGWHITITLTESDINDTITISKKLVETKLVPLWGAKRSAKLLQPNSTEMVHLYECESKITTAVGMKRDENGNFKLDGWQGIQSKRNYRTGDVINFWWDQNNGTLNFELIMIANESSQPGCSFMH
ncbi:unnamed protein product [Eruca vesicaria subsp. sativa]|uniref:TF-B3 domain-containing protein n=1 Tax=Eruca vesicaria subsp. sativa TaxID=29727 RepID=A0ABC8IST8_ERUVS|nr:unnamed protein product [Eruca vesicaria subsp. sativa]